MLKSINPTDESVVFERETDNNNEVNRKLDSAKHGFSDWKTKSFSERAKLLHSFANSLRDDKVRLDLDCLFHYLRCEIEGYKHSLDVPLGS